MKEFTATLLREKFEIREVQKTSGQRNSNTEDAPEDAPETVTALSNRIVIPFEISHTAEVEEFVIRSHTMHSSVRLARELIQDFQRRGPLGNRVDKIDWARHWDRVMTPEQQSFDPDYWCAVYLNGKLVYSDQNHHPFLDVIEKFAARPDVEYENSLALAEDAFAKAGKDVRIFHDSKIAAIIEIRQKSTRAGIIIRSPKKTTTCNISIEKLNKKDDHIRPSFDLCAAYLEGIHHSFMIGHLEKTIKDKASDLVGQTRRRIKKSRDRLYDIQRMTDTLGRQINVQYRPEKPNFKQIIYETMQSRV